MTNIPLRGQWMFNEHDELVFKVVFVRGHQVRTVYAQTSFSGNVARAMEGVQ